MIDNLLQEKLELKDFNIENEAQGLDKAVIKNFTAVVTNQVLMIRFHWAGKGTTAAPKRGIYGPLVSAISVESGNVSGFDNLFVVQLLSCLDLIGIQCNHSNLVEAEPHNYLQLKFEKKD